MLLHVRQVKFHGQSATLPPAAVILNNNENTKEATAKITRQPKIVSAHLVVCKRRAQVAHRTRLPGACMPAPTLSEVMMALLGGLMIGHES